jgi:RNA polymerase sigma-70 factor (ECF subfamily)
MSLAPFATILCLSCACLVPRDTGEVSEIFDETEGACGDTKSRVSAPAMTPLRAEPGPARAGRDLDVDRLKSGDSREFARLVECVQSSIAGICQAQGLRGADIDEAMTDILSAVYLALPSFRAEAQLTTWVYRIAIRTVLRCKGRWRRNAIETLAHAPDETAPADNPARRAETREDHARVWEMVARLDARQALAIELFYRQGWSIEQIASAMSCPGNTVKTLLSRARERLRCLLKEPVTP